MRRDLIAILFLGVFLVGVGGQFGLFWALILGGLAGVLLTFATAFVDTEREKK